MAGKTPDTLAKIKSGKMITLRTTLLAHPSALPKAANPPATPSIFARKS
jgi:hypothetical protein